MHTYRHLIGAAALASILLLASDVAAQSAPESDVEAQETPEQQAPATQQPDETKDEDAAKENASAASPEEIPVPKTHPPDLGYGEHTLSIGDHFPQLARRARVDRRGEIDAMADRAILWPTAYTPKQHSFSVSNYMLYGNQLSYAATDDVLLSSTFVFPTQNIDFMTGLSAKIGLYESYLVSLAIQPFGFYHAGNNELDTRDIGFGVGVLSDLNVTDDFVVHLGLHGYGTVWYSQDRFDYSRCMDSDTPRQDFIEGRCTEVVSDSQAFPSGGHWAVAQLGATYYILDSLSLRGELFTGPVFGSFLATEYITNANQTIAQRRQRFQEGPLAFGVPYDGEVTLGGGLAWSSETLGLQLSGYAYRADDLGDRVTREPDAPEFEGWRFTPMLNGSVAF